MFNIVNTHCLATIIICNTIETAVIPKCASDPPSQVTTRAFRLKNTHRLRGWGSWGPGARPQPLLPKGLVLGEVPGQLHERVRTPAFRLHQLPHRHGDRRLSDGQRFGTEVPGAKPLPNPQLSPYLGEAVVGRWPLSSPAPSATAPTSARSRGVGALLPPPSKATALRLGLSSGLHDCGLRRRDRRQPPPTDGPEPQGTGRTIPQLSCTGALAGQGRGDTPRDRKPSPLHPQSPGEHCWGPFPLRKSPEPLPLLGRSRPTPPALRAPSLPYPGRCSSSAPRDPRGHREGCGKTRKVSSRPLGAPHSPLRAKPHDQPGYLVRAGGGGERRGWGAGWGELGHKGAVTAARRSRTCGSCLEGRGLKSATQRDGRSHGS